MHQDVQHQEDSEESNIDEVAGEPSFNPAFNLADYDIGPYERG
jgi:hypothetical protein